MFKKLRRDTSDNKYLKINNIRSMQVNEFTENGHSKGPVYH